MCPTLGVQAHFLLQDPAVQDYNLTVAMKMYAKKGLQTSKAYEAVSRHIFDAEVEPLDFSDGQRAAEAIESWVETKTDGKIRQLMSPSRFPCSCDFSIRHSRLSRCHFLYQLHMEFNSTFTECRHKARAGECNPFQKPLGVQI